MGTKSGAQRRWGELRASMIGKRFGLLIVMKEAPSKNGRAMFECVCDCGHSSVVTGDNLRRGATKSCGCGVRKNSRSADFLAMKEMWRGMKRRCEDPKMKGFKNYGGRGIAVCERWQVFENFLEDMGARPTGMTLERKDNNGDYTPNNCLWATRTEQQNNMRTNVVLSHKGKTLTAAQWAREAGLPYHVVRKRLKRGWPIGRIISTPLMQEFSHG